MENEIINWLKDHWQYLFALLGIPAFFKSFRQRIADIWKSPIEIKKLEDGLKEHDEKNDEQHAEASEKREKNKKELKQDIKELHKKIDDNQRDVMGHLIEISSKLGGGK